MARIYRMMRRKLKFTNAKLLPILIMLLLIQGAHSEPVSKNEVEDLNIIISQVLGGQPNVLFITDYSGSMVRGWGGTQVGNWDEEDDRGAEEDCEDRYGEGSSNARMLAAHCIENVTNLSVCGSKTHGGAGIVGDRDEFTRFMECINDPPGGGGTPALTETQIDMIFDQQCGNNDGAYTEDIDDCGVSSTTNNEFGHAAAAMDSLAGFTQCSSVYCQDNSNPACDRSDEYNGSNSFESCIRNVQNISINNDVNCSVSENENCVGVPRYGSSRVDMVHSVLFDFLDADDSLDSLECIDDGHSINPDNLFDGESSIISCQEYMFTPFRNVRRIAQFQGGSNYSDRRLPHPDGSYSSLLWSLTEDDGEELGIRLRGMQFSGRGVYDGCTGQSTRIQTQSDSFRNSGQDSFRDFWQFFRRQRGDGGTPLAWTLGLDDTNNSSNSRNGVSTSTRIKDDAIRAFKTELETDPGIECRRQFVIFITDGEDTCAGDSSGSSGSGQTTGSITSNANRRSSIQAVSNLRSYYARNPIVVDGKTIYKEIFVFVIGIGIEKPSAVRTLNAMALAGGTSTQGIIKHTGPDGFNVGKASVEAGGIGSLIPGSSGDDFDIFRDLAKAEPTGNDFDTIQLQNCGPGNVNENTGVCQFQGTNVFDNNFFDTGVPFNSTTPLDGFAFFVDDADDLTEALTQIAENIGVVSTTGVSPAAPQSSTAVALRDRIFLSILTPITTERLWQGRLGLYGFVDLHDNIGAKAIIAKPDGESSIDQEAIERLTIFDSDGTLNDNAKKFFWETGKQLAERDIEDTNTIRNLYTVQAPDITNIDLTLENPLDSSYFHTDGGIIRYTGPFIPLADGITPPSGDSSLEPPGPGQFGISEDDVTDPIPSLCLPPSGIETLCMESGGTTTDCSDVSDPDCIECVKTCLKDKVVDFLIGNTNIPTVGDPMGSPLIGSPNSEDENYIGFNCPDPEDSGETPGDLSRCSVRLGDIFHSSPVIVGSPSALFFDQGFQLFASAFRTRSAVVYIGANDGFLHAFHAGEFSDPNLAGAKTENPFTLETETFPFYDEGTGFELFGVAMPTYMPDSISSPSSEADALAEIVFGTPNPPDYRTGDFKDFVIDNQAQRSFSDGSPIVADIYIDGFENGIENIEECSTESVSTPDGEIDICGKEWHTVLLAGSRNGGGAYIAMDISNPSCGNNDLKGTNGDDCTTNAQGRAKLVGADSGDSLDYPQHLWTFFDPNFGNTWSAPTIGRIRLSFTVGAQVKFVDRWVMFVGGGIDPTDDDPSDGVTFGNAIVAIDISTGKEIFKFHPTNPIPSGADEPDNIDQMVCEVASRVGTYDLNSDGYMDVLYAGDTCGRLWRFDISKPIEVSGSIASSGRDGDLDIIANDWTGSIAYCANTAAECFDNSDNPAVPQNNVEAIFFSPTVVLDDLGRRHVIFITGDRRDPSNMDKAGKLYNFIDDYIPAFLAGGSAIGGNSIKTATTLISANQVIELQDQSGQAGQFISSVGNTFNADQGEFMVIFPANVLEDEDDAENGEKGFGTPVVINRALIFTTYSPDTGTESACKSGSGFGSVFAIDFVSGVAALNRIPGAKSSISGSNPHHVAGKAVAQGMPTQTQLTHGAQGSIIMSVAFTGGPNTGTSGGSQFLVWELPPFPTRTQTLFWQEIL